MTETHNPKHMHCIVLYMFYSVYKKRQYIKYILRIILCVLLYIIRTVTKKIKNVLHI